MKSARLYLVTEDGKEYVAIVTDESFLTEMLEDCEVVDSADLIGEYSSWPTNRLLSQE